jgi:protein-ribulosamine 3-kinase
MTIEGLFDEIERCAGIRIVQGRASPVSGGSIDRVYRVEATPAPVFVKTATRAALPMLEVEALGLDALRDAGGVRVPEVLATGTSADVAFLALEWIELRAPSATAERSFGRGLAQLHRATADAYGWKYDNRIGATPQPNTMSSDWASFFAERRLKHQLELAVDAGLPLVASRAVASLIDDLDRVVGAHPIQPSLVHGDLWGGNWAATNNAEPVLFDPAVHYADREVDIAMTRLFGGFGPAFYDAYCAEWPLPDGWERRAIAYNLYHLLNHFNLFGRGYLGQLTASLEALGYSR